MMSFKKRDLRYFPLWLTLGWLLIFAIFYLSLIPHPPEVVTIKNGDKVHHLLAYSSLMFWFTQLYQEKSYSLLAALFVFQGVLIECLQYFTGYRALELADILANTTGVLLVFFWARMKGAGGLNLLEQKIHSLFSKR